jgi:hypothetical protein
MEIRPYSSGSASDGDGGGSGSGRHSGVKVTPERPPRNEGGIHRSPDMVSLFRKNNTNYSNFVTFAAPKISLEPQEQEDAVLEYTPEEAPEMTTDEAADSVTELRNAAPSSSPGNAAVAKESQSTQSATVYNPRSHYRFNGKSIINALSMNKTANSKGSITDYDNLIDHWLWDVVYRWWSEGYLKALLLWATWMISGTSFYAIRNKFGWAKGFYMMVNVGYSIGSGYPREIDSQSLWFSIFNILVGVIAIGIGLNAFAQSVLHNGKSWYESAEYDRRMADPLVPFKEKVKFWFSINKSKVRTVLAFLMWGTFMTFWASRAFPEWIFVECLYFAISFLSTGGLYPMPQDAARYNLAVAGCFICFGVPLMCLAMGNIAALLLKFGDPEKDKQIIRGQITKEELAMMTEFGIDDGDGYVDRAEFILLCAVRLGAATPELVEEINKRFVTLDTGKRGVLTREEILQERYFKSPNVASGNLVKEGRGSRS